MKLSIGMNIDELVPYTVAYIAKEVGFNLPVVHRLEVDNLRLREVNREDWNSKGSDYVSIPNYKELEVWLELNHSIVIDVISNLVPNSIDHKEVIIYKNGKPLLEYIPKSNYYKDILEDALEQALKELPRNNTDKLSISGYNYQRYLSKLGTLIPPPYREVYLDMLSEYRYIVNKEVKIVYLGIVDNTFLFEIILSSPLKMDDISKITMKSIEDINDVIKTVREFNKLANSNFDNLTTEDIINVEELKQDIKNK